ncbi:hypothetical protein LUCX_122 [Xanthomonas phage vB_XciM_LucasX]|nr:hypothetical protein LUCX_122 [Xanthomonas phage vB_XciM_LucasX]
MEGSSWEVLYYSQVLGAGSEPGPWQLERNPTDQQYVRIANMEIKVTAALSPNEDTEGRSFDVVGTATVYPHIKPNIGDMFIADIGDGRRGLFAITDVNRKTYLRESYAEITYNLVNYADSRPEIEQDLERKTIKRTVFYREFLQFGQNPQLLEGEFNVLLDMQRLYADLLNFYLRDFYSGQYQTLLIPGQAGPAYDSHLTKAMVDWISTDESPMIKKVRMPVVTANANSQAYTLWDALSRMNYSYLQAAIQRARLLPTNAFKGMPEISSIYYTGIAYVVCPEDPRTDVDAPHECNPVTYSGGSLLAMTRLRWKDLLRYTPTGVLKGFTPEDPNASQLPDIVPVTMDDYYVLSEKFYRPSDAPMASKLEVLTKQGLMQEPIDKVTLLALARSAMNWPNLERFYYMPILFALMKVALRTN